MPEHITVYREPGRFAGWPANYGIWSWGKEIVVGFTLGYMDLQGGFHARDTSRPFMPMQARSTDGGRTWEVSRFPGETPGGRGLSADEHVDAGLRVGEVLDEPGGPTVCPGVDFTHPDFALMCARTGLKVGVRSFFYTSTDRCRSWDGPYWLPTFDQPGVAARTDYDITGAETCTLFLTANKGNGREGRPFCARTTDGGCTFTLRAFIGEEFEAEGHAIMPAHVRLSPDDLLVAVRCRGGGRDFAVQRHWIDLYASHDDGLTWAHHARPVPDTGHNGNPPTLLRLQDGRLCLTYGYRAEPFGIRARIGSPDGSAWSEPIVLRDDGGNADLGYPRTVQRPDGTLVTAYYFNDAPDGERYIAATLWEA